MTLDAHDRRPARRAVRRDARPARRARHRHAEVRSNDRKLLFGDIGVVTMRPSDVPTYVEAGAADVGFTGKDVLTEQSERTSTSCSTSATGVHDGPGDRRRARPGRGGAAAPRRHPRRDEVPEDRGRLLRAHRPPGRDRGGQGLGRARAADRPRRGDRRPHGDRHDAARERPRRARGDLPVDGAAHRQPGRHKLKARGDRRRSSTGCVRAVRCASTPRGRRGPAAAAQRARWPRAARRSPTRWRALVDGRARRRRRRAARARRAARRRRRRPGAPDRRRAGDAAGADVAAGLHTAIANVMFVADAGGRRRPGGRRCRRASGSVLREVPVRRAGVYVPGGRVPLPSTLVMGVVTARAAGVEEVCVAHAAARAPGHPGRRALLGVTEVYAMGGAHAVAALAYGTEEVERVDVICGPGNLTAGGQAPGLRERRDRRLLRPQRRPRHRRRDRRPAAHRPRPARPGRARARDRRRGDRPTTPRCWTPSPRRSPSWRPIARRPIRRGSRSRTRRR